MWTAYESYEPVYGFVSRFSAETGARLSEIVALEWRNVDLTNGRVLIEHTWDPTAGLVAPKSGEARTVHLTPEARAVLEEWVREVGAHDDGPVFLNPFGGGRLNPRMVGRRLDSAMVAAGVPKIHPELRLPRSFHSFRYTTSVLMQRRGVHPRLIEQTLGHGSLELTYGVYGGWTPDQLSEEAGRDRT
jgi:integrase